MEGARIELHPGNKSYFQARVDLPGTTECRIDEPPNLIYSCKWKPPQSQPPGTAPCDKLLADIQAALGAEWSRTDSPKPQAGKDYIQEQRALSYDGGDSHASDQTYACLHHRDLHFAGRG